MISKKAFLKAYQDVKKLDKEEPEHNPIYRSKRDEELIKEYHFAKFQKNTQQLSESSEFKDLLEKENWTKEDVTRFLSQLK
jgi:3-oxoacyl-[acyl-carrier-protein] synthase III